MLGNRDIDIVVAMILIGDVNVMTCPHIVTDVDRKVSDNSRTTTDQTTIANRLLGSSVLKNQNGAAVKLYVCTKYDSNGDPDDSESLYIEADIAITGVSFSVNPDDPTTGELSFSVRKIVSAFGVS